jgi:hypothetical protein
MTYSERLEQNIELKNKSNRGLPIMIIFCEVAWTIFDSKEEIRKNWLMQLMNDHTRARSNEINGYRNARLCTIHSLYQHIIYL